MTDSSNQVWANVPSPFCGIASDDLTIQVSGTHVKVLENGDAVTVAGFEQPITDIQPRVAGRPVSLQEAVTAAAGHLKNAHLPLFGGFGTDVNDTRAALSLADRCGAVLDQARAEGGLRNLLVLADTGWMATTLAEVKNRVDVLVVFGSDIEADFPRFYERFVWNQETLFGQDTSEREVIYIGRAPSGDASTSPDGRRAKVLTCPTETLPDVAAALNALAGGARLQAESVGGIAVAELSAVVERLRAAKYSVITWAAGHLAFPHADLTVQQICQCVVKLNKAGTRSSALPLGGQDGDRTASQVFAWQSGYPTRFSYARGYPEYDPYHFSTARLLASGEADVLLWVASLNANQTPPASAQIPTIVIGRSGMSFEKEPEVFIPVGAPGIDHAGHMYRCDNVVALPLRKLRESGLPTAASVLAAIEQAL